MRQTDSALCSRLAESAMRVNRRNKSAPAAPSGASQREAENRVGQMARESPIRKKPARGSPSGIVLVGLVDHHVPKESLRADRSRVRAHRGRLVIWKLSS